MKNIPACCSCNCIIHLRVKGKPLTNSSPASSTHTHTHTRVPFYNSHQRKNVVSNAWLLKRPKHTLYSGHLFIITTGQLRQVIWVFVRLFFVFFCRMAFVCLCCEAACSWLRFSHRNQAWHSVSQDCCHQHNLQYSIGAVMDLPPCPPRESPLQLPVYSHPSPSPNLCIVFCN